jgi:hypothetical protein
MHSQEQLLPSRQTAPQRENCIVQLLAPAVEHGKFRRHWLVSVALVSVPLGEPFEHLELELRGLGQRDTGSVFSEEVLIATALTRTCKSSCVK